MKWVNPLTAFTNAFQIAYSIDRRAARKLALQVVKQCLVNYVR